MKWMESLKHLSDILREQAGGETELLIYAGSVLVVLTVVGALLIKYLLRSDGGYFRAILTGALPLVLGVAAWATSHAYFNPSLFDFQGHSMDLAIASGIIFFLVGGTWIAGKLLASGVIPSLLFLVLVYSASAGGILIANASIIVFRSGSTQVEQHQEPLNEEG